MVFDGGTTSVAIARRLPPEFHGTVITTSPPVASTLAAYPHIEVILVGGRLYRYAMVAVGAETVARLRTLHADVCVLGVWALHPTVGLSVPDYEEAQVKRAMVASAPRVLAPTIAAKLGTLATFAVAPVTAITHLVTEADAPANLTAVYREQGVTVVQG
jgi:DeoR/GlpR family transcriptional regulator of sugar metabolism